MITKEKITGMLGATIFMVLLLMILLFSFFTLANPSQELEGIPVMFGNLEDASGYEEAPNREITPPIEEIKAPKVTPKEAPLISQTTEQSISIEEQKNKEKEREERRKQQEAERKRQEEEAKKRAISKELSGLFGDNSNASRGSTEGEGTQGVSTGNAPQGASSGLGGIGTYALGGRSLGSGGLVQPKYTVDDYGKVVINITVDPKGNVINAEIGRGTNTPSTSLRNDAKRAAESTKFNSINSPNNQEGTITYNFKLN